MFVLICIIYKKNIKKQKQTKQHKKQQTQTNAPNLGCTLALLVRWGVKPWRQPGASCALGDHTLAPVVRCGVKPWRQPGARGVKLCRRCPNGPFSEIHNIKSKNAVFLYVRT